MNILLITNPGGYTNEFKQDFRNHGIMAISVNVIFGAPNTNN